MGLFSGFSTAIASCPAPTAALDDDDDGLEELRASEPTARSDSLAPRFALDGLDAAPATART